ncbi:MAG: hypothetical protein EXR69_06265 [Myxococcales bacterium]|nr:hypothetical protein [Myxococcales bacterium]
MNGPLDHCALRSLIEAAGERLAGDWLLVGGGAAALWFHASRLTEDVDLIALDGSNEQRLALMDLALASGLPVEVVNSAADHFVRRIPGWRNELEVLHAGPAATIYRPSATLFLLLKIGRLTEKDLDDCRELIAFAGHHAFDAGRVQAALAALPQPDDAALCARRAALGGLLG